MEVGGWRAETSSCGASVIPVSLAAAVAFAPALAKLWFGGRFAALVDDPALPERLLGHAKLSAFTIAVPLTALIYLWPHYLYWTLPLLSSRAPQRRIHSGSCCTARRGASASTCRFSCGCSPCLRLLVRARLRAVCRNPWWTLPVDRRRCVRAADGCVEHSLCGSVSLPAQDATRRAAGPDGALPEHGDAAGIAATRFEYVDMRGGVLANALALPSLRGHSVLVTSTLLERLELEEVIAICAHELAHFDHFTRARLRRSSAATWALIAVGMLSPMLVARFPGVMACRFSG